MGNFFPKGTKQADYLREYAKRLTTVEGKMFLQRPPRYSPKLTYDLQKFLAAWPREVQLAVEVRHLGPIARTERVLIVRSAAFAATARRGLHQRLAQAQAALEALTRNRVAGVASLRSSRLYRRLSKSFLRTMTSKDSSRFNSSAKLNNEPSAPTVTDLPVSSNTIVKARLSST